jgi:hypothetical protein
VPYLTPGMVDRSVVVSADGLAYVVHVPLVAARTEQVTNLT